MSSIRGRFLRPELTLLPKSAMHRFLRHLAYLPLPSPFSWTSVSLFARLYGIDLREAEGRIRDYRTIGDLLTRRLKVGARRVDRRPNRLVSPADGKVTSFGRIDEETLIEAEGRKYSLSELLESQEDARRFENGSWVTVALSPKDHHRVHHPGEGKVTKARYIPGGLRRLTQSLVHKGDRPLCFHERLITFVEGRSGQVATVMFGTTSVGHITAKYDEQIQFSRHHGDGEYHFNQGIEVPRGSELGIFHLGSTVIVLIESPEVQLEPLKENAPIRMGAAIGRSKTTRERADA